jgi:tetratricopeptide (TPR) repeat protein
VWGPDHPNAVRYEINLAAKYGSIYDCVPALAAARHARKALTGVLAPTSVEHLVLDRIIGFCLYKQEDYPTALAENLAREQALHAAGADHTSDMADAWMDLGSVELELHRPADAVAHYARAVVLLEEIVGVTDLRLVEPLAREGDAEQTMGHTARATPLLERALVIATNANAAPLSLADVQYPLAQALWPRPANRVRARALAAAARAAFVAGGKPYESWVERISEWQRTHR